METTLYDNPTTELLDAELAIEYHRAAINACESRKLTNTERDGIAKLLAKEATQ